MNIDVLKERETPSRGTWGLVKGLFNPFVQVNAGKNRMFLTHTHTCDCCFQWVKWLCVIQSGTAETNTIKPSRAARERRDCVSSCVCVGPIYQLLVLSSAERREDCNPCNTHTHTHTCEMVCLCHTCTPTNTNNNCDITATIKVCQSWPQTTNPVTHTRRTLSHQPAFSEAGRLSAYLVTTLLTSPYLIG